MYALPIPARIRRRRTGGRRLPPPSRDPRSPEGPAAAATDSARASRRRRARCSRRCAESRRRRRSPCRAARLRPRYVGSEQGVRAAKPRPPRPRDQDGGDRGDLHRPHGPHCSWSRTSNSDWAVRPRAPRRTLASRTRTASPVARWMPPSRPSCGLVTTLCAWPLRSSGNGGALLQNPLMSSDGIGRIVVGVDGSEHARRTLQWAVDEARLRKWAVIAVHAHAIPNLFVAPDPVLGGVASCRRSGKSPSGSRRRRKSCSKRRSTRSGATTSQSNAASSPARLRTRCSGRRAETARRGLTGPRRIQGPPARLGQPTGRAPRALPRGDRAPGRARLARSRWCSSLDAVRRTAGEPGRYRADSTPSSSDQFPISLLRRVDDAIGVLRARVALEEVTGLGCVLVIALGVEGEVDVAGLSGSKP